jgi:uncharacterized membrane protein
MALPALSIPPIPLPVQIPADIHPCIIHLAVALPVVIVLMELVNLVAKKRALGVFSFFLMILTAVILFAAYLTGGVDAENAKAALTGEAKTLFEAHKLQGVYLVYGAAVLAVIKLLSVLIRKTPMRVIFLIFLLAFTALTVNTAKKGKMLVFGYGINVKTAGASAAASPATSKSEAPAAAAEEKRAEAPGAATAAPVKEEAKSEAAAAAPKTEAKSEAPKAEKANPVEKVSETVEKTVESMEKKAEEAVEKVAEPAATAPEAPSAPEAPEAPQAPAHQ